jgi:hypothetical protein
MPLVLQFCFCSKSNSSTGTNSSSSQNTYLIEGSLNDPSISFAMHDSIDTIGSFDDTFQVASFTYALQNPAIDSTWLIMASSWNNLLTNMESSSEDSSWQDVPVYINRIYYQSALFLSLCWVQNEPTKLMFCTEWRTKSFIQDTLAQSKFRILLVKP